MVVPMLEHLLGWSDFEASLFFCGAGVLVGTIILLCMFYNVVFSI